MSSDQHHLEHSDVIRVIGHSHESFAHAVSTALQELADPKDGHDHHPGYEFVSFRTTAMHGKVEHDPKSKTAKVVHYSVEMDVEARHFHD
ncbi:MAG: hypothetical protein AAF288_12070 [Planctomycetota bacterium]